MGRAAFLVPLKNMAVSILCPLGAKNWTQRTGPMGPHGDPMGSHGTHGNPWEPMGTYREFMGTHGGPWEPMDPWVPMGPHGNPWVLMGTHGNPWDPWGPMGTPWGPMGTHDSSWGPMGAHGSPWAPMGPHGDPRSTTETFPFSVFIIHGFPHGFSIELSMVFPWFFHSIFNGFSMDRFPMNLP